MRSHHHHHVHAPHTRQECLSHDDERRPHTTTTTTTTTTSSVPPGRGRRPRGFARDRRSRRDRAARVGADRRDAARRGDGEPALRALAHERRRADALPHRVVARGDAAHAGTHAGVPRRRASRVPFTQRGGGPLRARLLRSRTRSACRTAATPASGSCARSRARCGASGARGAERSAERTVERSAERTVSRRADRVSRRRRAWLAPRPPSGPPSSGARWALRPLPYCARRHPEASAGAVLPSNSARRHHASGEPFNSARRHRAPPTPTTRRIIIYIISPLRIASRGARRQLRGRPDAHQEHDVLVELLRRAVPRQGDESPSPRDSSELCHRRR